MESNCDVNVVSPGRAMLVMGLYVVAFMFYVAGLADCVLCNFFQIDFTGVRWSPIAFGVVGGLLMALAGKIAPNDGEYEK